MATSRRPRQPMPMDVNERLEFSGTRSAYARRSAYQRNDYLIWIDEAKTSGTRDKRVRQMIDELKRGNGRLTKTTNRISAQRLRIS